MDVVLLQNAHDVYSAQEALRSARARDDQNAARTAWHSSAFDVSGVGDISVQTPIMFDTIFVQKPMQSSGIVLRKMPTDLSLTFPMANVGTWKWVTELTPAAASRRKRALASANSTRARKAALAKFDASLTDADYLWKGAYPYFTVQVSSLVDDLVVTPDVRLTFNVTWMGVAYKELSDVQEGLYADPSATPNRAGA